MELLCSVKNYDWGQIGENSLVAQLAVKNDPNFVINSSVPYAEFWIGTHPSGESILKINELPLSKFIELNPTCLNQAPTSFGTSIPFLMKVLSVKKALSIQVHPNKIEAERLHKEFPKLYTDDNHKPELAVALTEFKAMCGFRPLEEISGFIQSIPELSNLIDPGFSHSFVKRPSVDLLEKCFSSYMTASPIEARRSAAQFIDRISASDFKVKEAQLADLFIELNKQFPWDIGLFAVYFLNIVTLKPGQAIFLDAGVPHAYIYGDCVEVMASSDNVVRAGLTQKSRDVNTLLQIINVKPMATEDVKFEGRIFDKYVSIYKPPVADFALSRICVPEGVTYTLPVHKQASILVVIDGSAECEFFEIDRGIVVFVSSEQLVTFTVTKDLLMFQAYPNV